MNQKKNLYPHPSSRPDLFDLVTSWPAPFVERQYVGQFSGGILNPRTMSNLDSKGEGPKGRIKIGNKIAYPVAELVEWMTEKAICLDDTGGFNKDQNKTPVGSDQEICREEELAWPTNQRREK